MCMRSKDFIYRQLPKDYCFTFLAMAQMLHEGMTIVIRRLNSLIRPLPRFRKFFVWKKVDPPTTDAKINEE
jgi:hypothetical protein